MARNSKRPANPKSPTRGAEAIADEIAATYPFHPRLKNVVALFKENEQFKQTRGLIELVSRLLRSVWDGKANDVFLIGPQHFDLSIPEVRDKLTEISGMRDVIAKDLWDGNARRTPKSWISRRARRLRLRSVRCSYRQPFYRGQRRQGAHARGDGRVTGFAAARSIGFPRGLRGA